MTELAIGFLIVGLAACVWQLFLFAAFVGMLASGKYKNVTVGIIPGIIGVILVIIGLVL